MGEGAASCLWGFRPADSFGWGLRPAAAFPIPLRVLAVLLPRAAGFFGAMVEETGGVKWNLRDGGKLPVTVSTSGMASVFSCYAAPSQVECWKGRAD
jgi:hypothetical protein